MNQTFRTAMTRALVLALPMYGQALAGEKSVTPKDKAANSIPAQPAPAAAPAAPEEKMSHPKKAKKSKKSAEMPGGAVQAVSQGTGGERSGTLGN